MCAAEAWTVLGEKTKKVAGKTDRLSGLWRPQGFASLGGGDYSHHGGGGGVFKCHCCSSVALDTAIFGVLDDTVTKK